MNVNEKMLFAYVGNYSKPNEGGISICQYDSENGSFELIKTVRQDIMAGQLCMDNKRKVLYVVDERANNPDLGGKGGGRVFAFSIDPTNGELTEINRQISFCTNPTFLTLDATGNYLLLCSHSTDDSCLKVRKDAFGKYSLEIVNNDGVIVLFPLNEDGSICDPCDIKVFCSEDGVFSCMHSINMSPDGMYFAACERNQNKVRFLRLNYDRRCLEICSEACFPWGTTYKNGHAPRYGVFHPAKPLFYFNSEYKPLITTMLYNDAGSLETVNIQKAIPQLEGMENAKLSLSDLCIDSAGKYMYALYRIVDVICCFEIDENTGIPKMVQSMKLLGKGPRGMKMSPDGKHIIVANRDTKELETLNIQPDGLLVQPDIRSGGFDYPSVIAFFEG